MKQGCNDSSMYANQLISPVSKEGKTKNKVISIDIEKAFDKFNIPS
jgi:hypothetical protein